MVLIASVAERQASHGVQVKRLLTSGGCLLSLSGLLIEFARLSTITPQTKAIMVFGSLLCLEPSALGKLLVSPLLLVVLLYLGSISL